MRHAADAVTAKLKEFTMKSNCTIIFVDFKRWRSSTRIVYMDKWHEPEESTKYVECPF